MYNHYFYTFNNYYNRQIKRYNTKAEYDAVAIKVGDKTANFEFSDGVNTTAGMTALQWNALSSIPDYMLLCDTANNILSRWFVIEAKLECGGNYTLYLRRDLVADFYDATVNAPAFIEKAMLRTTDPLIWNSEEMTYNQIKKREIELKDKTKMPWIVGYYALKNTEEEDETSGPVAVGIADYDIDEIVDGIEKYKYYNWTVKPYYYLSKAQLQVNCYQTRFGGNIQYRFYPQENYYTEEPTNGTNIGYTAQFTNPQSALNSLVSKMGTMNLQQMFIDTVLTIDGITYNQLATLRSISNKVIKDNLTGKIYRTNLRIGEINEWSKPSQDIERDPLYQTVQTNTHSIIGGAFSVLFANNPLYQYNITQQKILFTLDEITPTKGHFINIDPDRRQLNDAPYCMFCMPYGEVKITYLDEDTYKSFTTSKENALTIGSGLLANKPGYVYDVQILPFCPIQAVKNAFSNNEIILDSLTDTVDYTRSAFGINQVIFWGETSQGSFDISVMDCIEELQVMVSQSLYNDIGLWFTSFETWNPIDTKIASECSMYRLCSPNYASMFEYNISKNAGINEKNIGDNFTIFHVDYGYKPFTPYVRVAPIFGGLYGTNYNDARGLILSGDFSITSTTDKWQEYQLQNKNYQLAFDRQIENMEVNKKYGHIQDIAGAIAGTIANTTSGYMVGKNFGLGSSGAGLIGGVSGGVSSAIAGTADVIINQNLRNEAIDYTKDNFGFALGNIQALPNTLNKVSAINPNFRYFPILEIYDATDDEKNALRQKIKYNGMTVGRINTISAYLQDEPTYIKAQLIRLEGIADDTHVLNELANEIMKGVYIAYVNTTISKPDNE